MLKRAGNWVLVALIAALYGFTGILRWTAGIAQSVFFICIAFGAFSLLLSLFEAPSPRDRKIPIHTLIR